MRNVSLANIWEKVLFDTRLSLNGRDTGRMLIIMLRSSKTSPESISSKTEKIAKIVYEKCVLKSLLRGCTVN